MKNMWEVNKGNIFLGILMAIFWGCSQTKFGPEEYVNYVNDKENGFIQTEQVGDYEISVQYRTPEYMTIKEIGVDVLTNEIFSETSKEKNGAYYFLFQIMSSNKKSDPLELNMQDKLEYTSRISHLMSGIDEDIFLVSGDDTLPCKMHHFERSYHLTHYHNIVLVFERKTEKQADNLKLFYNDRMLNIGRLNFVFNKHVTDVPKIIL
jgi:hypothetical protein